MSEKTLRERVRAALFDAFEAGWFDNHGSIADAWEERAEDVMELPNVLALLEDEPAEALRTQEAEPVGEEEAVALAKSYGYVVIHRSAWEFMRDDPHPERRDWNSPIGQPLDGEGSDG